MYELKKNGKVFTSKFVGTGPSSYEETITGLDRTQHTHCSRHAATSIV